MNNIIPKANYTKDKFYNIFKRKKVKILKKLSYAENLWAITDSFVTKKIEKSKNKNFSNQNEVREIEHSLMKEGVNIRFKDNLKLASFMKKCLDKTKQKKLKLPPNILFLPSFFSKLTSIQGLTYNFRNNPEKITIFLPKNIYKIKNGEHTVFHEIGHWLHFKNNPDIQENCKIWNKEADLEYIEKNISKRATVLNDGSELCAESLAQQIEEKNLPNDIIDLVKKLGGQVLEN